MCSRVWVFTMGGDLCAPRRKVWKVRICHPSCLHWSVQLRSVIVTLNLQILFLLRLNCVSVTAGSGDLLGNCACFVLHQNHVSRLGLLFELPWFMCMCVFLLFCIFMLLIWPFFPPSVAQGHVTSICLFMITQCPVSVTRILIIFCLSGDELRTHIQA